MADLFQILVTPVSKPDDTALVAGTVDFYSPGTTGESNRKDVFTDQGGTIASANPITLDAQATAAVYGVGQFHIVIKDASENVVYDYDYITPQQTGIVIYEVQEVHVATAGQTVFDLAQSYNPSTLSNGIAVYVEGARQNPDVYTETDADTITFGSGITEDDEVMFVINFYDTAAEGIGTVISDSAAKTTPVLADIIAILDSEASDALKQVTLTNLFKTLNLHSTKTTPIIADSAVIIDSEASNAVKLATLNSFLIGSLIDVQVFTSDDTWTKPTGCTAAEVTVIGGGGAGGGGPAVLGSFGTGGGGGGGSYKHITGGLGATEVVTVGAAGAGNLGASGDDGGDSSFGAHATADGGTGGGAVSNPVEWSGGGGAGGASASGDINISGGGGGGGFYLATPSTGEVAHGGGGGNSPFGYGIGAKPRPRGDSLGGASYTGLPGIGYGAGGGGASIEDTADVKAGGAGTVGIIIVKSYR